MQRHFQEKQIWVDKKHVICDLDILILYRRIGASIMTHAAYYIIIIQT